MYAQKFLLARKCPFSGHPLTRLIWTNVSNFKNTWIIIIIIIIIIIVIIIIIESTVIINLDLRNNSNKITVKCSKCAVEKMIFFYN